MRITLAQNKFPVASGPHLTGTQARMYLTTLGLALMGGVLAQVNAQSSGHSGRSTGAAAQNKPVTRAEHPGESSEVGAFWNLQRFLVLNSLEALRGDDIQFKVPPYQRIPAEQAPVYQTAGVVFPQEPESQPGIPYDQPSTLIKSHDNARLVPSDAAARIRGDWSAVQLASRSIKDEIGADGVPYSDPPPAQTQTQLEYGPERTVEAGPVAYSASGGLYQSGFYVHRDLVATQSVVQYAPASFCDNLTEQRFMYPFRDVPVYKENLCHTEACQAGNNAARRFLKLAHSAPTSQRRGFYARRAAWKYHLAYVDAYHKCKTRMSRRFLSVTALNGR